MLSNYEQFLYGPLGNFPLVLIGVLLIWSLVWKGYGLWKAANDGQKYWFIAFLVLNTMGILPILSKEKEIKIASGVFKIV